MVETYRPDNIDEPTTFLTEWRKAKKMTLEQVAARIGLSKATLSRVENGAVAVTLYHLSALSAAYQVTIPELIYRRPRHSEIPEVGPVRFRRALPPNAAQPKNTKSRARKGKIGTASRVSDMRDGTF